MVYWGRSSKTLPMKCFINFMDLKIYDINFMDLKIHEFLKPQL